MAYIHIVGKYSATPMLHAMQDFNQAHCGNCATIKKLHYLKMADCKQLSRVRPMAIENGTIIKIKINICTPSV